MSTRERLLGLAIAVVFTTSVVALLGTPDPTPLDGVISAVVGRSLAFSSSYSIEGAGSTVTILGDGVADLGTRRADVSLQMFIADDELASSTAVMNDEGLFLRGPVVRPLVSGQGIETDSWVRLDRSPTDWVLLRSGAPDIEQLLVLLPELEDVEETRQASPDRRSGRRFTGVLGLDSVLSSRGLDVSTYAENMMALQPGYMSRSGAISLAEDIFAIDVHFDVLVDEQGRLSRVVSEFAPGDAGASLGLGRDSTVRVEFDVNAYDVTTDGVGVSPPDFVEGL